MAKACKLTLWHYIKPQTTCHKRATTELPCPQLSHFSSGVLLTLIMAKAQLIARFAIEVAPSQLSTILRRRRALPRVLDTIAEDEKEAAAVELSSYALLRTKAPPQNLSCTAMEVGKSSVHGERCPVAHEPLAVPHAEELAVLA
ncbi:hypothetical protein BAE44_0022200 [Dichanthelium oligosanthes]|uniref:Uncharacterized protein n=1 Tax=Dichanthelium oligosanthes TaxID=888268 RepID=A0A1E5UV30_9POAL|nr:hypothetical protein BAE44_0022200 [Dichanthelium oligosanthes]